MAQTLEQQATDLQKFFEGEGCRCHPSDGLYDLFMEYALRNGMRAQQSAIELMLDQLGIKSVTIEDFRLMQPQAFWEAVRNELTPETTHA
jgi:hypothetical protein